jgi:hypothetical protein
VSVAIQVGPSEQLLKLEERLKPLYARLAEHRLYATFKTIEDLRIFMEAHVFAVWDFMSLLKALQRGLTCVDVPWVPCRLPASRRLINEIVMGEESDTYEGVGTSHFELYCRAMQECGASLFAIDHLLLALHDGVGWNEALSQCEAPIAAQIFVRNTFEYIDSGKLHVTAAAFTFGREDLIPDMFQGFIRDQDERLSGRLSIFRWYLDRHIEVDGEVHGPLALQMIDDLCGDDPIKWQEASAAAEQALYARLALWDCIADAVLASRAA